jgi:hypothetical protein
MAPAAAHDLAGILQQTYPELASRIESDLRKIAQAA